MDIKNKEKSKNPKQKNQQNNQNSVKESSPEDKNIEKMKSNDDSITPLAKSEEHIYSYANEKKKTTPNTPLKKPFKMASIITGVIGLYLLCFSIFLIVRGGYASASLNDLNANCRNAMVILSVFVLFTAGTGYSGAYTNWKPLVLTFAVFSSMCLVGHFYVAKKELDAVRFSRRDMALSWWDVYTDEIRKGIQEKYNCCGYRYYSDLPVASANCLESDVIAIKAIDPTLKKDAAKTKKFDSYQKNFGVDTDSGTTAGTTATGDTAAAGGDTAATGDTAAAGGDTAAAGGVDPAAAPAAGDTAAAGGDAAAAAVFKRQDDTAITNSNDNLAIKNAVPCEGFIVEEINSKLKLVYIINFALCLVYVIDIALSLKYWTNMRKEKEFDEFA